MTHLFSRPPAPITILIADDHHLLRRGVRAELEAFPDQIEIVGEAKNVAETLELAQELIPDVVLLDLRMPKSPGTVDDWRHGIAAISQIVKLVPHTHILVLSMYEEADVFFKALRAGANGYISKRTPYSGEDLTNAIRRIVAGEAIYGPSVAPLIRDYHNQPPDTLSPLTRRERHVLDLLVEGKSNQEIAAALMMSMGTVKTHVSSILKKMQVKRREQLWHNGA